MSYKRRRGIDWENDLYHDCLRFLNNKKIMVEENTYSNMAFDQLRDLSIAIFPNYGHRKYYPDQVRYFLEVNYQTISADLARIENGLESIHAPKLHAWNQYKAKLCTAMCLDSISQYTDKFLSDITYKLPVYARTIILNEIHTDKEDEMNRNFNEKKLNNCLWFNRAELCNDIKLNKAISTHRNDETSSNDCLHEFTKDEIDLSVTNHHKLSTFYHKLTNASTVNCNRTLSESSELNNIPDQPPDSKKRQRKTRKSYVRAASVHEKVSGNVLEFFKRKDTDDRVQLMKKLVIISCVPNKNEAFIKFMQGTGRIKHETKKIILETLYDNENVKQSHYTLLELLISDRYLIRQKVKEVLTFFKNNDINFDKECVGMAFFEDVESRFYEVIENSNSTRESE